MSEASPTTSAPFPLKPGDCTKHVSVGNKAGLTYIFDGDHPNAYTYIDIAA